MERDRQFETQYVLSLALGIISFAAVGSLRDFAPVTLCYVSLISPAIQIVLFNVVYTFDTVYDFELDARHRYDQVGRANVLLMTILFALIISNTAVSWLTFLVGRYTQTWGLPAVSTSRVTLIGWLLSFAAIVFVGLPALLGIFSARGLRDINTTIGPPNPRVVSNFRDSTSVYVQVTNETDQDQEFSIVFDVGEGLEWRIDGMNGTGKFTYSLSVDAERRERADLELQCTGGGSKSVPIGVEIKHNSGSQSKQLNAICRG